MKTIRINLKTNLSLVVCFFTILNISAQVDSIETENCIRERVNIFFVEKDKLNKKDNNGNLVHILEIVEKRVLGYDKVGIYFCSNAPSRQKYLLLKSENDFKILTSKDFLEIMQEVILFLKKNKIEEEKSIVYLRECLNILSENNNKPFEEKLNEQQWTHCN